MALRSQGEKQYFRGKSIVWSSQASKTKHSIANSDANGVDPDGTFFLPVFADGQSLRLLLTTANLMALFMALVSLPHFSAFSIGHVLGYLLFTNWVAISSAIVSDAIRATLKRLSRWLVLLICLLVFESMVALFSVGANLLMSVIQVSPWQTAHVLDELSQHLLLGGMMGALILHYLYLREQLIVRNRAELLSRVQALQARIRPHFLFNSMNTLSALISIDAERAEQAVQDMSALFRASLNAAGEISLLDEIELCQHYLALESLRLGDRLRIDWRLPDDDTLYDLTIPSLTLQPLLENAVYHGVEGRAEPSTISILVECDVDEVRIVVTNPCQTGTKNHKGNRMALNNIEERLQVYYGAKARMTLYQGDGLFTVYLSYPQDSTITNA